MATAFLRSRNSLGPEIVALRQQVTVLKRKDPRPRLRPWDQVLWAFCDGSGSVGGGVNESSRNPGVTRLSLGFGTVGTIAETLLPVRC